MRGNCKTPARMQAAIALLLFLLVVPGATAFSIRVFDILRRMQREGLPLPPPFDTWNATMLLPWANDTLEGFAHARSMMALGEVPGDPCTIGMQPPAPQAPVMYCEYLSDCTSCTNKCAPVPPAPMGEGNFMEFFMHKTMFETTLCPAISAFATAMLASSSAGAGSQPAATSGTPPTCPSAADLDAALAATPGGYSMFQTQIEAVTSTLFESDQSPELPFNDTPTLKAYTADNCVSMDAAAGAAAGMVGVGCISANMKKAMEVQGCDEDETESDSPDCAMAAETLDVTNPCTMRSQHMMGLTDGQMQAWMDAAKKMNDGCSAQSTAATCDAYDGSKIVQELKDAQATASPTAAGAFVIAALLAVSLLATI